VNVKLQLDENGTMVGSPTPVVVAGLRDAVAITVGGPGVEGGLRACAPFVILRSPKGNT